MIVINKINPIQIMWAPNKDSNIPVYKQIVKFIRDRIASGEWSIGTILPSQRKLAELFNVNRSTISIAMDELASYGIIQGSYGGGTKIVSNTWSLMLTSSTNWSDYVKYGFFQANNDTIQTINRLEFKDDIARLGTGELDPRLFPKDMWQKVILDISKNVNSLNYLEPLGLLDLRQEISKYMEKLGIVASPSCILITSGSLQALQLISACLLKSGDTIFTEAPTYVKSLKVFQSTGMKLSGVPLDKDGIKFWNIDSIIDSVDYNHSAILYTIPTNHNPTGVTMSSSRREDLIKYCIEKKLPIIEDGAYHELCFDDTYHSTLKSLDKNNMVVYLGTASKSFAPGIRIGWVIAPEPIVQRLGDVKMQMDYGASSISQYFFAELLRSGFYEEYLVYLKKELCIRRNNALSVLENHFKDIATWNIPNGGFYIWLTFKEKVNIEELFYRASKENILLNPGDIYDFKHNNSLRLSYSYTNSIEFENAIKKLADILMTRKDLYGFRN